jgi:hypothetical protein
MSYNPTWANGTAGRLTGGVDRIRLSDPDEIADAINRRRQLEYLSAQDFSSAIYSGARVREPLYDSALSPFNNFRSALAGGSALLHPSVGGLGGVPPTPSYMRWLWPVADADENKPITGTSPPTGEVGLLLKINGTNFWTDANLQAGITHVRAVHINELRQAIEYLRRGRWKMPIYWMAGLYDQVPDQNWTAEQVANSGYAELRGAGYACVRSDDDSLGLTNATARASSYIEITADYDCTVEVYQSSTEIDWANNLPCWNTPWGAPGGIDGNATSLGSVSLTAGVPGQITGSAVAAGLQKILDGDPATFIIRQTSVSYYTATISSSLCIDFDLKSPPN